MSEQTIIFVVDDDAASLHSTRFLLESEGHRVEIFSNGPQFLAALPGSRPGLMPGPLPSCVLLDHVMPGMDGLEVLGHIRNRDLRVPVVMMTGHPDPRIRIAASAAGVPLIEKPLGFAILRTMFRAAAIPQALSR